MWRLTQVMLTWLYVAMPVAALAWAAWPRTGAGRRVRGMLGVVAAGLVAAVGLMEANRRLLGGELPVREAGALAYFSVSAACVMWAVGGMVLRGLRRAMGVKQEEVHSARALAALLFQRVVMVALLIPYVAGVLMSYRPKVVGMEEPGRMKLTYAPAKFTTADGVDLAGWWIPSRRRGDKGEDRPETWSRRTVVVCHGVGSGKSAMLGVGKKLAERGWNVLLFDFRGHGESGGRLVSYGARERLDVLAAVKWGRVNHAEEAREIWVMGENTGAAAALGAASSGGEGEWISGLVLYEPFARFEGLARSVAEKALPGVVRWMVMRAGLPIASLHSGADLRGFAPIEMADGVWPRPALVVHGRGQTFVPVGESMELYQRLWFPKEAVWPADHTDAIRARVRKAYREGRLMTDAFREWIGINDTVMEDDVVLDRVLRFMEDAEAARVI